MDLTFPGSDVCNLMLQSRYKRWNLDPRGNDGIAHHRRDGAS
jgi:hypothetical protein